MKVYFDNAATTQLDKEVFNEMLPFMTEYFGNPSSIHSYGRKTRAAIEGSRKLVAKSLNVSPSEIFFTSGGTEADNMAIKCSIHDLGIKHAITTRIEHHAVLHTLQKLEQEGVIKLSFVNTKILLYSISWLILELYAILCFFIVIFFLYIFFFIFCCSISISLIDWFFIVNPTDQPRLIPNIIAIRVYIDEENECCICMDKNTNDWVNIPCGHAFHRECISQWLRTSHTCPVCRSSSVNIIYI